MSLWVIAETPAWPPIVASELRKAFPQVNKTPRESELLVRSL